MFCVLSRLIASLIFIYFNTLFLYRHTLKLDSLLEIILALAMVKEQLDSNRGSRSHHDLVDVAILFGVILCKVNKTSFAIILLDC
jgi:hypothetical protein